VVGDLGEVDLSLAAMLAGLAMAEEVEHRLAQAGFDDVVGREVDPADARGRRLVLAERGW
jgi:hypothetical protein